MPTKNLYCIMGKSGSGKSTIVDELKRRYGLVPLESYTTRPMRYPGEGGHTYITKEEFDQLKGILAYTVFDGHEYCATQEQADNSDLYVVDLDGVLTMGQTWESGRGYRVFGIVVPEEVLVARMRQRGDSEEAIAKRVKNDKEKFMHYEDVCGKLFENTGDLDSIVEAIKSEIDRLEA